MKYTRKLNKKGILTKTEADKELLAIHGIAHHYSIIQHPFASYYHEQEKHLTTALLDINRPNYNKLIQSYLKNYPEPFIRLTIS